MLQLTEEGKAELIVNCDQLQKIKIWVTVPVAFERDCMAVEEESRIQDKKKSARSGRSYRLRWVAVYATAALAVSTTLAKPCGSWMAISERTLRLRVMPALLQPSMKRL